MKRGKIIGEVWATRKAAGLTGLSMKLVALTEGQNEGKNDNDGESATGTVIVALDTLDARTGQDVLVALGSGARNVVQQTRRSIGAGDGDGNRHLLADAAIALLIDDDSSQPNQGEV